MLSVSIMVLLVKKSSGEPFFWNFTILHILYTKQYHPSYLRILTTSTGQNSGKVWNTRKFT